MKLEVSHDNNVIKCVLVDKEATDLSAIIKRERPNGKIENVKVSLFSRK
jgi:hypothetical protein